MKAIKTFALGIAAYGLLTGYAWILFAVIAVLDGTEAAPIVAFVVVVWMTILVVAIHALITSLTTTNKKQ